MFQFFVQAISSTIPVYLFFALGYWLRYRGHILPKHEGTLLFLSIDVGYPCLIFANIMNYMVIHDNKLLADPLFCLQAMGCGFFEMFVGMLMAFIVAKAIRLRIGRGFRTFVVSAGMQNYVFFAIPIIQIISKGSDDPAMGVLIIHNVGCEIFVWSLAVFLLSGKRDNLRLRSLMRGPLIAVAASLAIVWTGLGPYVALPPIINSAEILGALAPPINLIVCGCAMRDVITHFKWRPRLLSAGILVRLLVAPACILLAAWALPIDPSIKRIMVIQGAIPSAVTAAILARRFGGDPELATEVILSTTVCSIITLPLWLAVGNAYIVPIF